MGGTGCGANWVWLWWVMIMVEGSDKMWSTGEGNSISLQQSSYTKKILMNQITIVVISVTITHNGVITHLEPDILEWKLKWAFGSIIMNKTSGSDRILAKLFQILKDDALQVLHSIFQQIWKTQQWPQDWKRSVFILVPKKGNTKECSNYRTIALTSHVSKVMLKILQARLQQYMNWELPDVQVGFRKGRETRDHCQHLLDHWKCKRVPEKYLLLLYWLCQRLWLCGSQQTVENS